MASRRTLPIPIPGTELQRMREHLAPAYGSEVWEGEGHRILVVRTPGDEPDVVNDLEHAVEHLQPGDVQDLDHCLLVGGNRSTAVAVRPLQELMAQRVRRDKEVAILLRQQIGGRDGHVLWRDPSDRRRAHLALRIPRTRAGDIDEDDLDALADRLGPTLDTPAMRGVQAVHILADEDDVRIEADLLLQDLRHRWEDEDRRLRQEEEERRQKTAEEARRRAEREEITALLRRRAAATPAAPDPPGPATRTAHARGGRSVAFTQEGRSASPPDLHTAPRPRYGGTARASKAGLDRAELDALVDRASAARHRDLDHLGATDAPATTGAPSGLASARTALESLGYDIMEAPQVPGHAIDLAAERDGAPARVIVRAAPRLTLALAEDILRSCRELGTDLGLVVAPAADEEASERLVATKAKWVAPDDLAGLRL